jgi:hypothetical protein
LRETKEEQKEGGEEEGGEKERGEKEEGTRRLAAPHP